MPYKLFLDDIRQPQAVSLYCSPYLAEMYANEEWKIVRNYDEFVSCLLRNGLPHIVSFDHDLADIHYDPSTWVEGFVYQEKTGLDCAKYLVNMCIDFEVPIQHFPNHLVHSQNPVGAKNIDSYINNYKFKK